MAQKVQVILVDDFDGGEADETVGFALDGVSYEIDLSAGHAEKMREMLAVYVGSARRVGGRSSGAGRGRRSSGGTAGARAAAGSTGSGSGGDVARVREWARANGYIVNDRGRISAAVREAYDAAN